MSTPNSLIFLIPTADKRKFNYFKVDTFLDKMSTLTKEDEQQNELAKITRR